jgi:hypothetical protein
MNGPSRVRVMIWRGEVSGIALGISIHYYLCPMRNCCPITQEEIREGIVLRGTEFELVAILALLVNLGALATHPYSRTRFTDTELAHIHFQALIHRPLFLLEHGWLLKRNFLRDLKPNGTTLHGTAPSRTTPSRTAPSRSAPSRTTPDRSAPDRTAPRPPRPQTLEATYMCCGIELEESTITTAVVLTIVVIIAIVLVH